LANAEFVASSLKGTIIMTHPMTTDQERAAVVRWLHRMHDVYFAEASSLSRWSFIRRKVLVGRMSAILAAIHFIERGEHIRKDEGHG
jgi:hypothetical protein